MTRSLFVAMLLLVLTAPAVHGQARLLPPTEKPHDEIVKANSPPLMPEPPRLATMGTPTAVPPPPMPPPVVTPPVSSPPPESPQNAPPHQMQGREPAHGKLTSGVSEVLPPATPLPAPAFPAPQVCGPPGRAWVELDYIVWFAEGDKVPALLTTSPNGTPQNQAGVLHAPGTSVLLGGRRINDDARSGVRLSAGYWFDNLQTFGIQAGGFWLGNNNSSDGLVSSGDPILARPYRDATTGKQSSELVAYPGVSTGGVIVSARSSLDGWDIALRQNACCLCNGRVDAIVGYRQFRLADGLGVVEGLTSVGTPGPRGLPAGSELLVVDRFDTLNEFYGAEFGFLGEYRFCHWTVEGLAKVAAGWNVSHVNINGASFISPPGGPTTVNTGGLLALPSNIGLVRYSHPTLIPEFGVNVAYDMTAHLRFRSGYSFLYWDQVRRTGQQIDQTINPNLAPPGPGGGPVRPLVSRDETDIFVHGLNFGVEVRY